MVSGGFVAFKAEGDSLQLEADGTGSRRGVEEKQRGGGETDGERDGPQESGRGHA